MHVIIWGVPQIVCECVREYHEALEAEACATSTAHHLVALDPVTHRYLDPRTPAQKMKHQQK
eukprot:5077327-Amphidinium_carterae.1